MSTLEKLELQEFKDGIDLYSADFSRWPVDKIKPALALLDDDAQAKAYFENIAGVEDALRAYMPHPARMDALEKRIMAAVLADPAQEKPQETVRETVQDVDFSAQLAAISGTSVAEKRGFAWKPAYIFAPGGGLLAAAVLGFIIGALPHNSGTDFLVDPVYYAQSQVVSGDTDMYSGGFF